MAEADIRTALNTIIDNVTDSGLVYSYRPLATEWDTYLGLFKTTISGSSVIRAWTIGSPTVTPEGFVTAGSFANYNKLHYGYEILGNFGSDNNAATEPASFLIARNVQNALISNMQTSIINGISGVINATLPVLSFDARMFGGVLCHVAVITLSISENA